MIPAVHDLFTKKLQLNTQPSKNYKMHIEKNIVHGVCDGQEAMLQVIYKILNTERYLYPIYSWNYGLELRDLFGEPVSFVCAELKRRITEALMQDDRVKNVTDFEFDTGKRHEVVCAFVAHTIFGELKVEKEVAY